MIQYIIAAGIGAFLGSQSKKSKKSYAHGGEVVEDSDGNKYEIIEDYSDFKLGELGYNPLSGVVIPTDEEDIEMANENWHKVKKFSYAEGGYLYQESDDRDAEFTFQDKKEVNEFIKEHNRDFETNYKSIDDFNKGEEYRKITKSYAKGGKVEDGNSTAIPITGSLEGVDVKKVFEEGSDYHDFHEYTREEIDAIKKSEGSESDAYNAITLPKNFPWQTAEIISSVDPFEYITESTGWLVENGYDPKKYALWVHSKFGKNPKLLTNLIAQNDESYFDVVFLVEISKDEKEYLERSNPFRSSYYAHGGEVGKTYEIKGVDVTYYEDSYEEGELDQFHSYYLGQSDFPYKTEFSSKKDLFDTLNEFISYGDFSESDFEVDEDTIQTSALVKFEKDSDWDEFSAPTEKEKELWRKGKMKLYSALFVFPYEVYKKEQLDFAKGGEIAIPYGSFNVAINREIDGYGVSVLPYDVSEKQAKEIANAINGMKVNSAKAEISLPFAKGGKTQGYNARGDEELGMTDGKESRFQQSKKDRRDEMKGENRSARNKTYGSFKKGGMVDKKVIDHTNKKIKGWYKNAKQDHGVVGRGKTSIKDDEIIVDYVENGKKKSWSMAYYPSYVDDNGLDYFYNVWMEQA